MIPLSFPPCCRAKRLSGKISWKAILIFLAAVLVINGALLTWKLTHYQTILPGSVKLPAFDTPVRIQLLNGCGEGKIAQKLTDQFRAFGMDVVEVANAQSFDFPETVVLDRIADSLRAGAVATVIGLESGKIIHQANHQLLVDVTVIIGKDYSQLKLPTPPHR